jgi:signal transduction histidine kinase
MPSVSPFVQHHLLRIVREAVNNAVRHGAATRIDIRLSADRGRLNVEVADDGSGFDAHKRGAMPGHFGIRGMRERARRINADIAIHSTPGTGTTVSVSMPLPLGGAAS